MKFIPRVLDHAIHRLLSQDKSLLLLGPAQTGKTTLIDCQISCDLSYSFLDAPTRRDFEQDPEQLLTAIQTHKTQNNTEQPITILIDEVQKVPAIIEVIQYAIDHKLAKFILTASSIRRLKKCRPLQPIIILRVESLSVDEFAVFAPTVDDLLLYGTLAETMLQDDIAIKEELLRAYINRYLEYEVRSERVVRTVANFDRFLKYAAIESGNAVNMSYLSQEIGVTRATINDYYQILEDDLIVERIDALAVLPSPRRLSKMPKYLIFDLGIRRIAAAEGTSIPPKYYDELFKQFIGLELLKLLRAIAPQAKLYYWKDHNGPEVDYVIEYNRQYLPIEVIYSDKPSIGDAKHLLVFNQEYNCMELSIVICLQENTINIAHNVAAIHWQKISSTIRRLLSESQKMTFTF